MGKVNFKGGALLAPVPPVLVTCGCEEDGNANVLTVAWTGIVNTQPPKTYISVRPTRHSYPIIKENSEFVLNLTSAELVRAADYCGVYTGAKVNKFEKCHLTTEKANIVRCPIITESPMSIECKVTEVIPMGTHDMFLADIVSVSVSEEILDLKGKICLDKANLAAYVHGEYFALGKKLGTFGFSATKKKKKSPPKKPKQ